MQHRTGRAALAAALCTCLLPCPSRAADHGDQPMGLDVLAGFELAEGPPYPAPPVEFTAELRQPPPDPALPAGRLLLTLFDANDGMGAPTPLTGTAVDDGDPYGEPGDVVSMEVYHVPALPGDEYQGGIVQWKARPEAHSGDAVHYEFTGAEPLVLQVELFFEQYFRVDLRDAATNEFIEMLRLRMRVDLTDGQDLAIGQVSVFPPDSGGEVGVRFELGRLGGGLIDPDRPLYVLTLTTEPIEATPALPGSAMALLGAVLLAVAWRLGRRRAGSTPPRPG